MNLKKHNVVSALPFINQNLMGSPIDEGRAKAQRLVMRFENRLRLARASEMAKSGRLLEADALLRPGGNLSMSADELDLLARIHVKRGQFDSARRCWEDALKMGDRRAEFKECLKVLENWLVFRKRTWIWRVRLAMCVAALLLSIWLLVKLWSPFTI